MIGKEVHALVTAVQTRIKGFKTFYLGGGGNDTGRCRQMSLQFLKDRARLVLQGKDPTEDFQQTWERLRL